MVRFSGSLRRAAPGTGAERGDVDHGRIRAVEADPLGVGKRQTLHGRPGPARVVAPPEAGFRPAFRDAHVNAVRVPWVNGRPEAIVPLARHLRPGVTPVGRLVEAPFGVTRIGGTEVDHPAVARVNVIVL